MGKATAIVPKAQRRSRAKTRCVTAAIGRPATGPRASLAAISTIRSHLGWEVALAAAALAGWFAGHYPGTPSDLGIPVWVATGLALGMLQPRMGLIVTILVVPYTGGAVDPPPSELLRVIPLLGAGVRIAVDRLRATRTNGAPGGGMVGLTLIAAGLFILTAFTAYIDSPNAERLVLAALPWLLGAPIAFLAAWLVASHEVHLPDGSVVDAVLASTIVACLIALAGWWGASWTDPFLFTVSVSGRLAAFGYAPPTGMAIAFALPIAVAAARRRHVVASAAMLALGLIVIVLTGSRGPLLALGIGTLAGVAASRRLRPASFAAGAVFAAVAAVALVATRYPGYSIDQILTSVMAPDSEDALRVQTWRAALEIAAANPIFGGGWQSLARNPEVSVRGIADSHNMILAAFADGGIPLGLAFGGVVLFSVRMIWANRRIIPAYAMASAVTLLAAGLWDIPNLRSYGAVLGGLALGVVARNLPRQPVSVKRGQSQKGPSGSRE